MAYVYKYTDLKDNIVKYVGIVYSNQRSLKQRVSEHYARDAWCKQSTFRIEYFECRNKTEATALENHFISLYKTYKYYNKTPNNGKLSFVPQIEWKQYSIERSYSLYNIKELAYQYLYGTAKNKQSISMRLKNRNNFSDEYVNQINEYIFDIIQNIENCNDLQKVEINGIYLELYFNDGNKFGLTNGYFRNGTSYNPANSGIMIRSPFKGLNIEYLLNKIEYLNIIATAFGWKGTE